MKYNIIISRIESDRLVKMDTSFFENIVYNNFKYLTKVNNGSNHTRKEINRLCNNKNSFVLIATYNNQIIGYILGEKINLQQYNVFDNRTVYYITYLYVVPNYRNKGIATSLINCVMKNKKNVYGIMLTFDTFDNNLVSFYDKNKFYQDKIMTTGNRWDVYYKRYY
jgi:GNAT superfamily N-acetyltransferase